MKSHKTVFQTDSNGYQNGHADQAEPQRNDDGKMKRIERENFHLRLKLQDKDKMAKMIMQILTSLRTEHDNIKDKNFQLENEIIKLRANRDADGSRHPLPQPRVFNKKIRELHQKLRQSENKLESVKNENRKLIRKVSSERKQFEGQLETTQQKLKEKSETINKVESELKKEREKCELQNGKLLGACGKLESALNQLEKYENEIAVKNVLVKELKCKVKLLEPMLQENQKLKKWCVEAEKCMHNFERANKEDKLKITSLQRSCSKIKVKLAKKQEEVHGISEMRNMLFNFVHEVCTISQFPDDGNFSVQNKLSELVAHLKEMFKKFTHDQLQYQQTSSRSLSPQEKDRLDQLSKENVNSTVVSQHVEDVAKRNSGSVQGCESGAKYFCKCGHIVTSKNLLRVHIKQFNQQRRFLCFKCPNRFLHMGQLGRHLSEVHLMPNALDRFVVGCKFCGKMFKTKEKYLQHKISAHIVSYIKLFDFTGILFINQ